MPLFMLRCIYLRGRKFLWKQLQSQMFICHATKAGGIYFQYSVLYYSAYNAVHKWSTADSPHIIDTTEDQKHTKGFFLVQHISTTFHGLHT